MVVKTFCGNVWIFIDESDDKKVSAGTYVPTEMRLDFVRGRCYFRFGRKAKWPGMSPVVALHFRTPSLE